MKQRSMWAACFFSFTMGSFFLLLVYFLPIWFQAVKGASAVKSGIMNLPMVLSLIIVSILSGVGVTMLGYYAPFMILGTIFGAIGVGLLSTLTPDSGHAKWIGYQCIAGIGIGFGMQQPLIVSTFPFCYCQRSRFSDQKHVQKIIVLKTDIQIPTLWILQC